jgi:hypothetical protein
MASGDNVDVIEVVETTSFPGPAQPTVDHLRPDQSIVEEDCESPVLRGLCVCVPLA